MAIAIKFADNNNGCHHNCRAVTQKSLGAIKMVRLKPRSPEIPEKVGFTQSNDIFGLKPFGEQLADLAQSLEEPIVILLDGAWGSGKTIFVAQWAALLRGRGIPVINFDAFANDHFEDAFMALAGEIASQAETLTGDSKKLSSDFIAKAKKAGAVLLPFAVKAALRVGTLGVLSSDSLEGLNKDLGEAVKNSSEDAGLLAEALISERISKANSDRAELEAFKASLSTLAKALASSGKNKAGPVVFIIDELDRCRPPFALNVLERVKHLFAVDGVCFVLVANKPELEAIVRGNYGEDFDGSAYLHKFYQLRVTLPTTRVADRPNSLNRYIAYVWESLGLNSGEQNYDERTRSGLASLAVAHKLELRDIEHVMVNLALFLLATAKNHYRPDPLVVVLALLKIRNPQLYEHCVAGTVTWNDMSAFLMVGSWPQSDTRSGWYVDWWRGILDANWNDQQGTNAKQRIASTLFNYNFSEPIDALKWIAKVMLEIRVPPPTE